MTVFIAGIWLQAKCDSDSGAEVIRETTREFDQDVIQIQPSRGGLKSNSL